MSPVDNVKLFLSCLWLRWETDDKIYHTVDSNLGGDDIIDVGEWYGVVPFSSIGSVHHIVRSNYYVSPLKSELSWPLHRFYVERFCKSRKNACLCSFLYIPIEFSKTNVSFIRLFLKSDFWPLQLMKKIWKAHSSCVWWRLLFILRELNEYHLSLNMFQKTSFRAWSYQTPRYSNLG